MDLLSLFRKYLCLLALTASASSLSAQTTMDWKNDTTGSWFDPANWWSGTVPTSATNASIDNNGNASIPFNTGTAAQAATLNVGVANTGTLNVVSGGDLFATTGYIGNLPGANGTIIVNGGGSTLNFSSNFTVGSQGAGFLNVNAGGVVSNDYGHIAAVAGSSGTASIAGSTSAWNNTHDLLVGEGGVGVLSVSAGAAVTSAQGFLGYASTGVGEADLSGVGTTWTLGSNLFVGYSGSAHLDISAGAMAQSGTGATSSVAFIGHTTSGTGTVSVSGTGSAWKMKNDLNVGQAGYGQLSISNQAVVSNAYGTIGNESTGRGSVTLNAAGVWNNANDLLVGKAGTGDLSILESGRVTASSGYIGYASTGTGTVSVDGVGSRWINSSNFYVGYDGNGTLHVTNGAVVSSGSSAYVGQNSTGAGIVNLAGAGSAWSQTGDLHVGVAGSGTVNITSAAAADNTNGVVGESLGGIGEVNVLGGSSLWTNRGALTVGNAGQGKVNVTTGGQVTSASGTIGAASTGHGEVNVTGSSSQWATTGSLTIGASGTGAFNVTAGGAASAGSATVASGSTGYGELNMSGDGSSVTVTGDLSVGESGTGVLGVTDGALSNATGYIGHQAGSTGSATVFSGTWANASSLYVGYAGNGTLNLTGDGVVSVGSGTLVLANSAASNGTLNLGAGDTVGTLQASTVSGGSGTATVNFNHSGTVTFAPTLAGSLSVFKSGAGTTVFAHGNTYSGGTHINDGVLKVTNIAGSATGSGNVEINSLGTLTGGGSISGQVTVNGTIAPGDGLGTLQTGSEVWNSSGIYRWDVADMNTADLLLINGNLTIDSASGTPFKIVLNLLTDPEIFLAQLSLVENQSWILATASGGILPWTADQFFIDTSALGPDYTDKFSLAQVGNNLDLVYTVPEPSVSLLVAGGLGAIAVMMRRRRR